MQREHPLCQDIQESTPSNLGGIPVKRNTKPGASPSKRCFSFEVVYAAIPATRRKVRSFNYTIEAGKMVAVEKQPRKEKLTPEDHTRYVSSVYRYGG